MLRWANSLTLKSTFRLFLPILIALSLPGKTTQAQENQTKRKTQDAVEDITSDLQPPFKKAGGGSGKIPAVAAVVLRDGKIYGTGAVGVRKLGDDTPVSRNDKFHWGSCTKAATSTLAAVLVERGTIQWTTTIGDVFNRDSDKVHDDYKPVTLLQLVSHQSGCPSSLEGKHWLPFFGSKDAPQKQREDAAAILIAKKPEYKAGTKYVYSNMGYTIAGVILERKSGKTWEDLMRDELFKPLKMTSAGFGPPADAGKVNQPWGHRGTSPLEGKFADNPPVIGPAGTMHSSMEDLGRYLLLHLRRKPDSILKKAASFDKLHAVHNRPGMYGAGWVIKGEKPLVLWHNGSNTLWYMSIWVFPSLDYASAVATNSANSESKDLVGDLSNALVEKYALNRK